MARLYRPFDFSREKGVFRPLDLEKPMNILEPNFAGVMTSVRSTKSPNLVQIGCEMSPPHDGEI